jgi:2',3'-cyclic-nucleotide 2'-phosphodiesterase (5'-nucleotidase family)
MGAADVLSILPFGNLIFVVAVTAEQLYDSLENWVSGLSVYYNPWGVFGQARPYLHH